MARSFNGTSDVVSFGNLSSVVGGNNFSCSIWAKYLTTNVASYQSLFSQGTGRGGGGQDTFNFEYYANTDASFPNKFVVGTQANQQLLATGDGNWHHWGLSWNNSTTTLTGYFDGVKKNSGSAGSAAATSIATTIGVGHNSGGGLQEFSNVVTADPAIWGTILTDAEFAALGAGARPGVIRPLSLILWATVDGLASPEPDLSGNAHNGTVTGTSLASGPPFMRFTPRWPQFNTVAAAATFNPAWASRSNIIFDGVAT